MKLYLEDNEAIPAIQVLPDADAAPVGFTQSDTIEHWDKYRGNCADYKAARAEIKRLYNATTFAALSTAEKIIVCNYFIATVAERDTIYTTEQQVGLGQLFARDSVGARTLRASKATSEIFNRLTAAEAQTILDDTTGNPDLFVTYVNFGREGTVEGDNEGLFDYLEGRAGTTWATTGFDSHAFTPIGYASMAALATDLMKILKDGLY